MNSKDTQIGGTHYINKAIQPWEAFEAWGTPDEFRGFLRFNAMKYLSRYRDKGGMIDLRKAQHYITKLIEFECKHPTLIVPPAFTPSPGDPDIGNR